MLSLHTLAVIVVAIEECEIICDMTIGHPAILHMDTVLYNFCINITMCLYAVLCISLRLLAKISVYSYYSMQ